MEKFWDLSDNKKTAIILGILFTIASLVFCIGTFINKKSSINLTENELINLIDKDYEVYSFSEDKKTNTVEINLKGDLSKTELEYLTKNLNQKNLEFGWNKDKFIVNLYSPNCSISKSESFIIEGLKAKATLDNNKSNIILSEYVNISNVEKTNNLVSYYNVSLNKNDDDLILSLDMDFSNIEDDFDEIVKQAKTYISLFKENNKGKDNLDSIQLNLNYNDLYRQYVFHTKHNNTLEVIDIYSL